MRAVIFDAYGTLLDVHSAMERHAARLGPAWQEVSQTWRTKQIEYSWVRSLAGAHRDFAALTRDALVFAAAKHGIADPALLDEVEQAYRKLTPYPEVADVLRALRANGLRLAILSNGERTMLDQGVAHAGLTGLLDTVLSIDPVGIFKPAQPVYRYAADTLGVPAAETAFLSSNPWDAFGAHRFGFRVFWVNRLGQPEEYGLHALATSIPDLRPLPALLA